MDQTAGMIVVYTTLPAESDARKLGGELVNEGLAACVNILPGMTSIYRWQGAVESGDETILLVKTRRELEDEVLKVMSARHPYSVPALLVFEPKTVAASYLEWILAETARRS